MSQHTFEKIAVVGLGYIGLPTATMFASRKVKVVGIEVDTRTVEKINRGEVHIVEPSLDIAVNSAVREGYLSATVTPEPAQAFLIAVPTPFKGDNHQPDLSYIKAASRAIAPVLEAGNLVVLESTSPIGATEQMADWLAEARPDLTFPQTHGAASDIRIAHCPERVLPGKVMQELITNDRIIGGLTAKCSELAVELYKIFVEGDCIITNSRTAEFAKLTENSFRDVNIAFANELSIVCGKLGVDVWELISLANRHPRVNILQPGPGVGGHCIAVDPWFIVSSAPDETRLIKTAREVNDSKPDWILDQVTAAIMSLGSAEGVTVACYGLAFKPDIDDLRESPALQITKALLARHPGHLLAVEPHISALPSSLSGAELVGMEDASKRAQVHVMLVDHQQFRRMPPPMGRIVDARGIWTPMGPDSLRIAAE